MANPNTGTSLVPVTARNKGSALLALPSSAIPPRTPPKKDRTRVRKENGEKGREKNLEAASNTKDL